MPRNESQQRADLVRTTTGTRLCFHFCFQFHFPVSLSFAFPKQSNGDMIPLQFYNSQSSSHEQKSTHKHRKTNPARKMLRKQTHDEIT